MFRYLKGFGLYNTERTDDDDEDEEELVYREEKAFWFWLITASTSGNSHELNTK